MKHIKKRLTIVTGQYHCTFTPSAKRHPFTLNYCNVTWEFISDNTVVTASKNLSGFSLNNPLHTSLSLVWCFEESAKEKSMWLTGSNGAVSGTVLYIHIMLYGAQKSLRTVRNVHCICYYEQINTVCILRAFLDLFQGLGGGLLSGKTGNMLWLLLKIQRWIDSLSEHRDKVCLDGVYLTVGIPIILLTGP